MSGANEFGAIVEEAYVYAFPMIVGYKALYDYNVDRSSGQFKAPFNEIASDARVFTYEDTAISTPNSDTPYSMVQADLHAEPIVLSLPEVDPGRYYSVQLSDMYTHNYGYMGSRTTGNGAGCYLIAGPDWKGEKPAGIAKVFRCETQFGFVIFRTQLFGPADIENVKRIQAGYKVQTLSGYLGTSAPLAPGAINWPKPTADALKADFAKFLEFLLQFCPPAGTAEVEKPLRARFARIGIGTGTPVDFTVLAPQFKAQLPVALKRAAESIETAVGQIGKAKNGWQIGSAQGNRAYYNGDWLRRAAAARVGIYGNDAAEATYPFTRSDVNGHALDASKHKYTLTFAAGQFPPVDAFWSVTMYDSKTQLLIKNPIDRYLINSTMLPTLAKSADGSLTIYIQRDSPGKDKEPNWLPAPDGPIFMVMRLYRPKETPPSILPPGEGSWQPPGVFPAGDVEGAPGGGATSTRAAATSHLAHPGDKSLENVIRTDERYGHDGLFHGPRGKAYWDRLESPKPIQNPNLWPDTQSTYFLGRFAMPAGSTLTLRSQYPHAHYFQLALYKFEHDTFTSINEALAGPAIEPDPGSENPFRVGANRRSENRSFTVRIAAENAPEDPAQRARNVLCVGREGGDVEAVIRIYLSDQGYDGAGWKLLESSSHESGFPTYEGTLADGTKLAAEEVVAQWSKPFAATKPAMTVEDWEALLHAPSNDPALDPATAPAPRPPRWEKFWTLKYSVAGAFKRPEDRAKIPYAGSMEGAGDPTTQYMLTYLSRRFRPVYVMRGKMPSFPDTYAGNDGKGLAVMPLAQTQYWSLVSCEAPPSGRVVDGLTDMQVPLDADGNYTIVVSRPEDRPSNASGEHGVAWLNWGERGEGLDDPRNRPDFGMLILRIMANSPSWKNRPDQIAMPGMEGAVMGPYYPEGYYTTRVEFEAEGPKKRIGITSVTDARDSTVKPYSITGTRNMRFGEILIVKEGGVEVYNTTGLNDCPPELWNALDLEQIKKRFGAGGPEERAPLLDDGFTNRVLRREGFVREPRSPVGGQARPRRCCKSCKGVRAL